MGKYPVPPKDRQRPVVTGKFPIPPKDRHRPPFNPVNPVDTGDDIKFQLMLETLEEELAKELARLLQLARVDGEVIE